MQQAERLPAEYLPNFGLSAGLDHVSRRIFGLTRQNGTLKTVRQIGSIPQGLVSFGAEIT